MKRNLLYLISTTILYVLSFSNLLSAQIITTVAGTGTPGYGGDGIPATSSKIGVVTCIAVDSADGIYIPDESNKRLRMADTSGIISTIAGTGVYGYTGDGFAATLAQIRLPHGVAVDRAGNVYFADGNSYCIRKIDVAGIITTVAGGTFGFSGDGGPATLAKFNIIMGIAIDGAGSLLVADEGNQRIRKITPATGGVITTIAGNGAGIFTGDGIPATAEGIDPNDIATDGAGNVYFADRYNNRIRKVDAAGIITTYAGNGTAGYSGDGVPATTTELNSPAGIARDACGNIYITDETNNRIRKVDASGIITTVAGNGTAAYGGDGGPATAALLNYPYGIRTDIKGNVFVADGGNWRIRKISSINRTPYFTGGHSQSFTICSDSTISVDSLLAVIDSDLQQGETWSVLAAPAHGTLAAAYTTISTGGKLVPSGLSYATSGGYTGSDSFRVIISDCADLRDTTSVLVVVKSCALASPLPSPEERVTLYPNPNTGVFTVMISSAFDEQANIVITNMVGQRVKESAMMTNTAAEVQLNVPAGVYFLSVSTANGNYVEKVTVGR